MFYIEKPQEKRIFNNLDSTNWLLPEKKKISSKILELHITKGQRKNDRKSRKKYERKSRG